MPTFELTSPDGKTYHVDGPEGATKEQAFQILQQQLGSGGQVSEEAPKQSKRQQDYLAQAAAAREKMPAPSILEAVRPHVPNMGAPVDVASTAFSTGAQMIPGFGAGVADMFHANKTRDFLDQQARSAAPLTATGQRYQEKLGDVISESGIQGLAPEVGAVGRVGELAAPSARQAGAAALRAPGAVADASAGALRSGAERLMTSALKPTLKEVRKGDAALAINTLLNDDIPLSRKGAEKIRENINDLNSKIKEAIQNSTGTVKLKDIEPLVKERLEAALKQANPTADVKAVNDAWEEFKNHPLIAGKDEIPVQLAQELKQGTYKQLSKKYGEMGSASIEVQKAIARGLKEGVAANAPEVVNFNKEESRLIRTLPLVERRVLMDANKNPLGLSLLAHNPTTWTAFMLDKSTAFKAMVARILNATGEKIPFQSERPKAPGMPPDPARPMTPPPITAAAIPDKFRSDVEKSRAVRDAEKFNMPPGRKLREWYYSDENPNNPLKAPGS